MTKTKGATIIDSLKLKLIEAGVEFVKTNIEKSKKELVNYAQKQVEIKIKKEISKITNKIIIYSLLGLGGIFILYGIFALGTYFLGLPSFITNLSFGFFLILIAMIFWLIYN